jgi:integral membrane sensor domain MASE1
MIWLITKALISAAVIVAVAEVADRFPRLGALLLTLPLISVLAFIMTWSKQGDMNTISQLARETLILVPLGLPFFIPLALASRTGLSFWPSFVVGLMLASITIGLWFRFGPSPPEAPSADDQQQLSEADP